MKTLEKKMVRKYTKMYKTMDRWRHSGWLVFYIYYYSEGSS